MNAIHMQLHNSEPYIVYILVLLCLLPNNYTVIYTLLYAQPHEDGPLYHPVVTTISLGSHTLLDFYKPINEADVSVRVYHLQLYNSCCT